MIFTSWVGAALSLFNGSAAETPRQAPDRNPVLLIHGIADNEGNMRWMARYLRQQGWDVRTLSLKPNWGQSGLDDLAAQIAAYTDREFRGRKFDLVGFSMGGLVSRYYVQRLGGLERVEHFVTISAPHNGTALAHFIGNRGCRQMRPGSDFLRDLATDAAELKRIKFTSIYTPLDLVILPARSSAMPQARNEKLPIVLHPLMILDRRSLRAVAAALES
jgi:triacylglycerol lipase